jgi:ferredoxin-NADP reductase
MPKKDSKLERKDEVAEGTMAFSLEKPAGFSFAPGQTIDLFVIPPPGPDPDSKMHTFSIASAPSDPHLMVATRMRPSVFKKALGALGPGAALKIDGPFGSFGPRSDPGGAASAHPAVFLAGGIGITPFRSILRHAAQSRSPARMFLFYANRAPEEAPFLDELMQMERANPNFTLVATMTQPRASGRPWAGLTGRVTAELLRRFIPDPAEPVYYSAGPAGMVTAMRAMLEGLGVEAERIVTEEFSGY